jgi:hypothetical protein
MREHGQGVACAARLRDQAQVVLLHTIQTGTDFIERIFSMVQTWKMQPRVAYHFITDAVQSWCGNRRPLSLKSEHSHLRHICV